MTSTHITDRSVQLAAEVYTRSGLALTVRPADASDKLLLEDFFKHVSADDLRFRFLTTIRRVDDARMDDLCVVDIPRKITFLALRGNLVVAIGTVAGAPDTRKAEVALTTRPEWKHQGVSWTLLEHLIQFAQGHGYREIVSIEAPDNAGALGLERDMGFRLSLLGADSSEFIASKTIDPD